MHEQGQWGRGQIQGASTKCSGSVQGGWTEQGLKKCETMLGQATCGGEEDLGK
jgi:hypothetical protein